MTFIFVALIVSWGLLWLYDRSTLEALGLIPALSRIEQFFVGLVGSAIVAFAGFYMVTIVTSSAILLNPEFTPLKFLSGSWWMLKSVLTEELIFRGALLYIAIRLIGPHLACLLSSIAFGIYHWFSYSVFGNAGQMIYVFLLTGLAGVTFSYAFAFTKSMYFPVGLHLGWNLIAVVVFSQGPLGNQLLLVHEGEKIPWLTAPFFLYQIAVLPLLAWIYINRKEFTLMHSRHQDRELT